MFRKILLYISMKAFHAFTLHVTCMIMRKREFVHIELLLLLIKWKILLNFFSHFKFRSMTFHQMLSAPSIIFCCQVARLEMPLLCSVKMAVQWFSCPLLVTFIHKSWRMLAMLVMVHSTLQIFWKWNTMI